MASLRTNKRDNTLFFDFRDGDSRVRHHTALKATLANRRLLKPKLDLLNAVLADGSHRAEQLAAPKVEVTLERQVERLALPAEAESDHVDLCPNFKVFADQWVEEHQIEWRRSHVRSLVSTLNSRLLPHFGSKPVSKINKADILAYRALLGKVKGRGGREGLSPKRINGVIGLLGQILAEAADRYDFISPTLHIKALRLRKVDVRPFTLEQVAQIIQAAPQAYKNYFTVRLLAGMRTGEAHGLKWKYVDFERRLILIRETFVMGEDEYTKTDGSQRDLQMSAPVEQALLRQRALTGGNSQYVFCNASGKPLDNKNLTERVWYPLLQSLGLEERRPYQMRHTAATLWLASGEAPEWIARQLGHTSTEMLFKVYSRYVPNLTRRDGSAFETLVSTTSASWK